MRIIDADKYRKDLLSAYDDISMELEVLDRQPLVSAIPIPEGMTNGDVIKAMLNPYKICEYEYSVHVYMTEKDFWEADYQMNCNVRWWNAPYKGNLSEKSTGSESEDIE